MNSRPGVCSLLVSEPCLGMYSCETQLEELDARLLKPRAGGGLRRRGLDAELSSKVSMRNCRRVDPAICLEHTADLVFSCLTLNTCFGYHNNACLLNQVVKDVREVPCFSVALYSPACL